VVFLEDMRKIVQEVGKLVALLLSVIGVFADVNLTLESAVYLLVGFAVGERDFEVGFVVVAGICQAYTV
jgi:hypothetical protein